MENNRKAFWGVAWVIGVMAVISLSGFTGCRSSQAARDESLVESRILVAVNAERNRWLEEFSRELGNRMAEGLREVDRRVDAVEGGLQQVAAAAREYRQFVLGIIDGLQYPESPEAEIDNNASNSNRGTSPVGH